MILVAEQTQVYLAAVDRWGNACSFINSNYMGFGTGIVPVAWHIMISCQGEFLENRWFL